MKKRLLVLISLALNSASFSGLAIITSNEAHAEGATGFLNSLLSGLFAEKSALVQPSAPDSKNPVVHPSYYPIPASSNTARQQPISHPPYTVSAVPLSEKEKTYKIESVYKAKTHNYKDMQESFSTLVKKAKKALVTIKASPLEHSGKHFFDENFFRLFFGKNRPYGQASTDQERSLGSGVIVDPKGLVVTCAHIIGNVRHVQIKISEHQTIDAEVVRVDTENDLALIKMHSDKPLKDLSYMKMGDVRDLQTGDWVIALGRPFGKTMVSSGVISALNKSKENWLLQTETTINPSNSGGALIDMEGNLVGIPSAFLSKGGAAQGINFAIPVNILHKFVWGKTKPANPALDKKRALPRWSGIEVQEISQKMAKRLSLPSTWGVLVHDIFIESPTLRAGLVKGDIITHINNRVIETLEDFNNLTSVLSANKKVQIKIMRQGRPAQIEFIIEAPIGSYASQVILQQNTPLKNVTVADINPKLIEQYALQISPRQKRAVVLKGNGRSLGAQKQLEPGDIIEKVNGRVIDSVYTLQQALQEKTNYFQLSYQRDGLLEEVNIDYDD